MAKVEIRVGGKDDGFHKFMSGVEKRVGGLKEKVGLSLGESLAALAGGATVTAMVDNMANFAKQISTASKNLGITVERVQQLRTVARHAGKDLDIFEGLFGKQENFARKALVPNSKEANIAARLGVTPEQLKNANKSDLLNAILGGTNKLPRGLAEGLLSQIFGNKGNAGFLLSARKEILNPSTQATASGSDIDRMTELKDTFEDLTDTVRVGLIPVFTSLIDWVNSLVGSFVQGTREMDELDAEAQGIYFNKNKEPIGAMTHFMANANYQTAAGMISLNPLSDEATKRKQLQKLQERVLRTEYGNDVYDELMKTFKPSAHAEVLDQLAAQRKLRADERAERNKEITGPAGRERPEIKTAVPKLMLPTEQGGSPLVKIGGLMGVDTSYRLERIGLETNKILMDIRKLLGEQEIQDIADYNSDPM